jgi:hypothetical protein
MGTDESAQVSNDEKSNARVVKIEELEERQPSLTPTSPK